MLISFHLLAAECSTFHPTPGLFRLQWPKLTTAGKQQLSSLSKITSRTCWLRDLWLLFKSPLNKSVTKRCCHPYLLPVLQAMNCMASALMPMGTNPQAKRASNFSDGCSINFLMLLATSPHCHEGTLDDVMDLAGIGFIFIIVTSRGLRFGFVLKTALISQGCFWHCTEVLTQHQDLPCLLPHPTSRWARDAQGVWRRHGWDSWPQVTKGIFHTLWHHVVYKE